MKYNKIKLVALCLCGAGLLASCSKDFLDREPSGLFTTDQLTKAQMWNPDILRAFPSGGISTTFAYGAGGIGGHSDFGQKSVDIQLDLMSGDMEQINATYGHFESASDLTLSKSSSNAYAYANWRYYYKLVLAANNIFDIIGTDEEVSKDASDENKLYFAQSKILRGFAYYYLVNLYGKPYMTDKDSPAIPLYRSAKEGIPSKRATVAEVYAQVIKDLSVARSVLESLPEEIKSQANKDNVNEDIATGLLAYSYLQMGDYTNAYKEATKLINNNSYSLMSARDVLESGFRDWRNSEFIWCIDLTTDNTAALPTFWGHVDIFTMSYASVGDAKIIAPDLYKQIPKNDVRINWFFPNAKSPFYLTPYNKFYDAGRRVQGDRTWTNDEVYMRIAEMYLVAAEAAARGNDAANAKVALKALLSHRYNYKAHDFDPKGLTPEEIKKKEAERNDAIKKGTDELIASIDNMNNSQLLEAIHYNWRVELWGEGRSLFTMKRFQSSVTRSTLSHALKGETYKYNDPRLTFEAPTNEVTNNPDYK